MLDPDSDVEAVDLVSNIEELHQRLEILLGARPSVPADAGERAARLKEAERTAQRERIAAAGGALVGAAFSFLSELIPGERADEATHLAEGIRRQLDDCIEIDEAGRPTLVVKLPDRAPLDALARALGGLLLQGNPALN